jgi:hypothetical protein
MEIRINKTALLATALVIIGVALRLMPHTDNFAPVGAIALFAGAVLAWRVAIWLPLAIMITSDLLFTWGGFMLVTLVGLLLRNQRNLVRIPLGALAASALFFAISNFGVWLEGKLYPHTWQGLVDCYVMALPFFRTSLLADVSFAALFFGLYAYAAPAFRGELRLRLPGFRADEA